MKNKNKNLINKKKYFSNVLIIIFVLFFLLSPFALNFENNLIIEKNYSQAEVLYYLLKYRQISTGKQITDPRKFGPNEYFKCDAERKIVEKETDSNGNLMFDSVVCSAQVTGEPEDKVGGNYDIVLTEEDDDEKNNFDIKQYKLLAPLPGLENYTVEGDCPLGDYFEIVFKLVLGIIAVIAVVMIVMGGVEYITSELVSGKTNGKNTIMNALFGLLLGLSAWLLLETINPKLLELCLKLDKVDVLISDVGGDPDSGFYNTTPISKEELEKMGIHCPGSGGVGELSKIANSFLDKKNNIVYSQSNRLEISGSNILLDCSSFVYQVYKCAGLSLPSTTTSGLFNNSNKVSGSIKLNVGDLVGWTNTESKTKNYVGKGHVFMYIGNNEYIEVTRSAGIRKIKLGYYKGEIRHQIKAK